MFAYSSISQAGYVLVGVQAASNTGTSAALFYLFTYTFIIIGTFAVVSIIQGRGEARTDLGAIRGLAKARPLLAAAMLVFLLAQAGVPFTSGFLAKFYVIEAAVQRGQYSLAIIAMLAAAVAAFFYLRVALLMYGSAEVGESGGSGGGIGGASRVDVGGGRLRCGPGLRRRHGRRPHDGRPGDGPVSRRSHCHGHPARSSRRGRGGAIAHGPGPGHLRRIHRLRRRVVADHRLRPARHHLRLIAGRADQYHYQGVRW